MPIGSWDALARPTRPFAAKAWNYSVEATEPPKESGTGLEPARLRQGLTGSGVLDKFDIRNYSRGSGRNPCALIIDGSGVGSSSAYAAVCSSVIVRPSCHAVSNRTSLRISRAEATCAS